MDRKIVEMREAILKVYPSGIIRGQRINDMSDAQIYAIYKFHKSRRIALDRPRMQKQRQIVGQTNIFNLM